MNFLRPTLAAALLAAGVWLTCGAWVQDGKPLPDGMKRWQEACTPGPAHKELARFIGTWDTETAFTGMGDDQKSKGTAEWRWLFDGRWIQQTWSGSMMGQPVQGQMTLGYDNFKQKYVGSSVNTLETTMQSYAGNFDQSHTALISYGKMDEPMTGEVDKPVKFVWRFEGKDKMTLEVHDLAIGETNTKVVTIVYTRRS